MKLNVLIFYNKKLECYTTPQFDDHEPESAATQLARSLKMNAKDEKIIKSYKHLDLYQLGRFDDSTGKLEVFKKPLPLLDCSKILEQEGVVIDPKDETLAEEVEN